MSVLLTAFKGIHNSSYQLIQTIGTDKLYLTNTFAGIDRDVNCFDFSLYNCVIMFGLDNRLKTSIRIEPKAMLDGNILSTVYDVGNFTEAFEMNSLKVSVAKKPTEYLCNYAYYRVLQAIAGRALFIHIPPEQYLTKEMITNLKTTINKIIEGETPMTHEERKILVRSYLGKTVTVKIDRPIGYVHKKENYSLTYPINYGYISGVIGSDSEELDVYVLGVSEPMREFTGRIIGIIHRENDVEDKLVAAPEGVIFNQAEIAEAVYFQEQYYITKVEMAE